MPDTVASPKSPVLVVAGMHRSGTSCVAGLLHSAGLFVGERLLAADPTNPLGHFEDLDFLDYHRRLLRDQGLSDDGFVSEPPHEPSLEFRRQADSLVESRRALLRPWGWKDPRTVLFLPFWHEVIPDARYLFVFRPPWDVVDSLFRRGDKAFVRNPSLALTVWAAYNTRLRDFARAHPDRVLLRELSQVVRDPEAVCDAVRRHLNVTLDRPQPICQPRLYRAADASHAALLAGTSPECVALLSEMRSLAEAPDVPLPQASQSANVSLPHGLAAWQQARQPAGASCRRPGQRVFIAVPVYRGDEFVAETLRSIQRQEHENFRVCISVDGGDHRSASVCEPFLTDPRFEMHVQSQRRGWAGNLNWLIERCDGDFFCFWQQDDLAATSYLQRLVGHARHYPETACVFSDVQWFGSRIDRVETPSLTGFALDRVLHQIEVAHYSPFFGLVRAAALANVGPIRLTADDSALEDQVWLARLVGQGPWHRVPGTLYFKRGHAGETHLRWEGSPHDAARRRIWLEWGAGMLEAAMSVSPPQEHGRLFDILIDRLTLGRDGRWLFYDAGAGGIEELASFRDDFASLARERYQVVGVGDRLLKEYATEADQCGSLEVVFAAGEPGVALLGGGWSDPEGGGVWSDGPKALLRLPLGDAGPWRIRLHAQPYPVANVTRRIMARVGDRIVAEHTCPADSREADEPWEFTVCGTRSVVLDIPWATSPQALGTGGDPRRLGICLHRVVLERGREQPANS